MGRFLFLFGLKRENNTFALKYKTPIMKTIKFIALATVVISLTACKTLESSNTAKDADIYGPTVFQKPVMADLEVKATKVTATYSCSSSVAESAAKSMALLEALKTSNADVLIEPRYEINRTLGKMEVIVTGYPASYTNFRPMVAADTLFINAANPASAGSTTTQGPLSLSKKFLKK